VPVSEYGLTMDGDDLKWMRRNVGTARCFAACLRLDSREWPVFIGYRGNYSRWFRKPSYDIWFADPDAFGGHAKLHLNAAYRDPSLLRGRLALELFSDLDVPTPRAWHVWLTLNQEPLGLYTAIESLDHRWLKRNGLAPGAIYYAVGTKGNFGLIDPDTGAPKRYLATGYEKCFPWDDNFSDLEQLLYAITLPDSPEFETRVDHVVDVNRVLRWLAGIEFLSHTDGLVQNYALFRPEGGLWQVSPWDCDGTLGRIPNGEIYYPDEMYVGVGTDNYLLARLLSTPASRERYLEIWAGALRGPLRTERVFDRLDATWNEIRPYALADENKRWSSSTFRKERGRIRAYVTDRTKYIRSRLTKPPSL
jgi:spore coat protein H